MAASTEKKNQRFPDPRRMLAAAAVSTLAASAASAAPIYWGAAGATNSWTTAANWYTDAAETSVSPSVPTGSSDVFFNTTPDNALGGTVSVSANIAAQSLTFNSSAATTLSQSGNRDFTLGTGGITLNSGGGNATLGTSTNSLSVQLTGNQTWTNNSTSTLNVRSLRVSNTASGPVELTLNAASTGSITFSLGSNDSPDTLKALSLVVDSAGSGNVSTVGSSFTGGTTVKRGLLSMGGTTSTLGTGGISLGVASGADDTRINLTGIATNAITVQSGAGSRALTGSGSGDFQGDITLNKDVSIGSVSTSAQTLKVSGAMSGTGNVTIGRVATGTVNPTVTLIGDSTYTGRTTVESATLVVDSLNRVVGGTTTSALGAPTTVADGTISIGAVSASTLRYIGTGETTDRVIDLAGGVNTVTLDQSGTGLLKFESDFTATGNGSKTLLLRGSTDGTGEISGIIPNSTSNTSVNKQDSGTWRLSGLNTYSGATSFGASGVAGGTLEVTHLSNGGVVSSIGQSSNASDRLVFGGTTLGGSTLRYVGAGDSTDRRFTVGASGAQFDASGSGAINWTNTASPTWTGSTERTLTLAGSSTANNTFAATFSNPSAGPLHLNKDGVGTWVLTGNSTYTGATTINGGTLIVGNGVSGSLANTAVAVNDTATLSGSGSIGGSVTVNAGGTLAPGNSPGILSTGDLTLAGDSILSVELNGTTVGSTYDQANVTGTVSIAGDLSAALGYAPTLGDNLFIINNDGADAVSGGFANLGVGDTIDLVYSSSTYRFVVSYVGDFGTNSATGGNDVVLTNVLVPEPASLAFIALSAVGLMRRRRVA